MTLKTKTNTLTAAPNGSNDSHHSSSKKKSSSYNRREESFKHLFSNGHAPRASNRLSVVSGEVSGTQQAHNTSNTINNHLFHQHNNSNGYFVNGHHKNHHHLHHEQRQHHEEGDWPHSTSSQFTSQTTKQERLVLVCNLRSKKQYVHNSNQIDTSHNLYQFFRHTIPTLSPSHLLRTYKNHKSSNNHHNNGSGSNSRQSNNNEVLSAQQQQKNNAQKDESSEQYYLLKDLWNFYDEPYGIDIPVVLDGRSEHAYFVPHLSAIQLYRRCSNSNEPATRREVSNDNNSMHNQESSTEVNDSKGDVIFEFNETLTPDLRYPLIDKIEELAQKQCPMLLEGTTLELDLKRSWYSIAWYPILCHSNTIPWLKGQIITYHHFVASNSMVDPAYCDAEFKDVLANAETKSNGTTTTGAGNNDGTESSDLIYAAPVIGFLPYKVKNETWFTRITKSSSDGTWQCKEQQLSAPLHLLRACKRILGKCDSRHADFDHCVQNCVELGSI